MNLPETDSNSDRYLVSRRWFETFWIDLLGVWLIFFLYAGNLVPDVNEAHYWTKAAHYWDKSFGAADLFLESGDVHWAFYSTLGVLTTWMTIDKAVWCGRFITWTLLAVGWTFLLHSIFDQRTSGENRDQQSFNKPPFQVRVPLCATLIGTLWLVGMEWGLWAGEWVVGGCESKGIAYAFSFLGLGFLCRYHNLTSSVTLGWASIGVGNLFHVVAGMWVTSTAWLAMLVASVFLDKIRFGDFLRKHAIGLSLCLVGFLAGAVPAVRMDLNTPRDKTTESAVQQVYSRLGHHLSPIKFSLSRWRGFVMLTCATGTLLLLAGQSRWRQSSPDLLSECARNELALMQPRGMKSRLLGSWRWILTAPFACRHLLLICLFAFAIAMVGLVFDVIFSNLAPRFAASVLRFYWFRWNDVTLPLIAAVLAVAICTEATILTQTRAKAIRWVVIMLSCFLGGALLLFRFQKNTQEFIPAGEKQNFVLKTDPPDVQNRQFEDWKRVCHWICRNTDSEGLWLTPRRQQSFKWRTKRAELAAWKDMPQNASAVVEWNSRLKDVYKFDQEKRLQPFSEEQLKTIVD